jgi:hypothetical protein
MIKNVVEDDFDIFHKFKIFFAFTFGKYAVLQRIGYSFQEINKMTYLNVYNLLFNILLKIFKASFKPNVKAYNVGHINIGM